MAMGKRGGVLPHPNLPPEGEGTLLDRRSPEVETGPGRACWIPASAGKTRERRPDWSAALPMVRFQSRLVGFRLLAVFLFAFFILFVDLFVQLLIDEILVLRLLFVEAAVFEGHS